ncbi:hypothetical protein FJK98_24615 [Micromonospora sp. HM134]|uniref:hypothetical protein n=1 Tax=unclassified Micromonospora TaxID=2617518 RepID=UPI00119853CB|nr:MULTISPECIES: hypothetical protein [unclassified Micromonospora]QDY09942.1 hypothetical protein FJK98_24615 [Micromonospora sp. HM134]
MKPGDVLHLTRAAGPQFVRPVFVRLIKIRTEPCAYHGWTWLDGYRLDEKGNAVARRELYVLKEGVRVVSSHPITTTREAGGSAPRSKL